jgi:hypothetical protein
MGISRQILKDTVTFTSSFVKSSSRKRSVFPIGSSYQSTFLHIVSEITAVNGSDKASLALPLCHFISHHRQKRESAYKNLLCLKAIGSVGVLVSNNHIVFVAHVVQAA